MNVRFVKKSEAPARAIPVSADAEPPKAERAAAAMFRGRDGEVAEVGGNRRRVLLLGLGERHDMEAAGALAVSRLYDLEHIALDARDRPASEAVSLAAGAVLRAWRFDRLITRDPPPSALPDRCRVERIDVMADHPKRAEAAWREIAPALAGVHFARDLVAEPSATKFPRALAERLRDLESEGIEVDIIDAAGLRGQGLNAILAVGAASIHEPCLVTMRWRGSSAVPPVALIGKGITFDTGGVNLKPGQGMWEMRADMAAAAACAGAMIAIARRRSPAPVTAILPLAENAIGASSYRPSDVLRTYDGTMVEVVDTDAEGRLVLADAIGWAKANLQPQAIIDLATLTGSIVTALGHHMAGLFSTHRRPGRPRRRRRLVRRRTCLAHAPRRGLPRSPQIRHRRPEALQRRLPPARRQPRRRIPQDLRRRHPLGPSRHRRRRSPRTPGRPPPRRPDRLGRPPARSTHQKPLRNSLTTHPTTDCFSFGNPSTSACGSRRCACTSSGGISAIHCFNETSA